jgi:hypothetical protein
MYWLIKGLEWIVSQYGTTTVIVVGSTVLSIIVVVAVLWIESIIKNRKDN